MDLDRYPDEYAQRREEHAAEEFDRERRRDRQAEVTPVDREYQGGFFQIGGLSLRTYQRAANTWIAELVGTSGTWEQAPSERAALGALVVSIARGHEPGCRRPWHTGPCVGVLRIDAPETASERYDRHVQAVEAVVIRFANEVLAQAAKGRGAPIDPTEWDAKLRDVAEECLAAADTGI